MVEPNRTEQATPKRKEEARKKGQVARSIELNTALGLLGVLVLFHFLGGHMLRQIDGVCRLAWGNLSGFDFTQQQFSHYLMVFMLKLVFILGPLFVGVFLIGVLTNVLQVGFLFSAEPLSLKFDNLNPAKGFERIFSRRTAVEALKGLLKVVLVALVAYFTIKGRLPEILDLLNTDLGSFLDRMAALSSALFLRVSLTLLALALLDYFYQRYEFNENLKMTKQEVKDEFRQMEGDPQIKAKIRQLQREASRKRMLADLPKADVVITNPTHFAVAIQYDGNSMDAPTVIAKGARLMAERIKTAARENGIPVMENKPLARALYEAVPVGAAVPGTLFNAVAELLAYVYQMQGTLAQKAEQNRARLSRQGKLVEPLVEPEK